MLRNRRRTPLQLKFPFPSVGEPIHPSSATSSLRSRTSSCQWCRMQRWHLLYLPISPPCKFASRFISLERLLKISVAIALVHSCVHCVIRALHLLTLDCFKLFGYLFNWALFGVLSVQVCACRHHFFRSSLISVQFRTDIYYISFPKDRLFAKCLVSAVYILETVQTAMLGHDAFETLAKGFGNVVALSSLQNEWLTVPIFTPSENVLWMKADKI